MPWRCRCGDRFGGAVLSAVPAGAVSVLPATKGLTMNSIASVTGGVDTHLDVHVAAALDQRGGLLGTRSFPTTPAGYRALVGWLRGFGEVVLVGVEGTGSYGAGLS